MIFLYFNSVNFEHKITIFTILKNAYKVKNYFNLE
jgi:hypothetical protein